VGEDGGAGEEGREVEGDGLLRLASCLSSFLSLASNLCLLQAFPFPNILQINVMAGARTASYYSCTSNYIFSLFAFANIVPTGGKNILTRY